MLPKSCRIQQNITTMWSDASRCLGSKIDRTSTNNIYRSSIVHLSNIYRTSIEHLSSIYWNAKSRSGKNKTAAQGRPNCRHVAEEKLERQRQEELQTQLWQWEEEQAQEKMGHSMDSFFGGVARVCGWRCHREVLGNRQRCSIFSIDVHRTEDGR